MKKLHKFFIKICNRKPNVKKGYILILSFFIIAMSVAFITAIIQKSFNYQKLSVIDYDRERARLLALGAINLAISQVSYVEPKEKKEQENKGSEKAKENDESEGEQDNKNNKKSESPGSIDKKRLTSLLAIINKWQTINLDQAQDDVSAEIKMYIACEQGKINLKTLYELQEKNKKQDKNLEKEDKDKNQDKDLDVDKAFDKSINSLFSKKTGLGLIETLKSRVGLLGRFIEDPSELFDQKDWQKLKDKAFLFYSSPSNKKDSEKERISLMDLFTVFPASGKLNPWLLSDATLNLFDMKQGDKKNVKEMLAKFKPTMDWKSDWDKVLSPVYGKKFASIPKAISDQFASDLEAISFSVLIFVKVGSVKQGICVILEKDEPENSEKSDKKSKNILFKINKIYWL